VIRDYQQWRASSVRPKQAKVVKETVSSPRHLQRDRFFVFIPEPDDIEAFGSVPVPKVEGDDVETVSVEILTVSNDYRDGVPTKGAIQIVEPGVQLHDRVPTEIDRRRRAYPESQSTNESKRPEVKHIQAMSNGEVEGPDEA
jgi:hypothetical protein